MKLPKDIPNIFKVKWSRYAARGGVTFVFSYVHLWGYIKYYPKFIRDRFQYVIVEARGPDWLMWRNKEDIEKLRKNLAKRAKNINYVHKTFEKMKKAILEYKQFGDKLKKISFSKLTNKQLAKIYLEHLWNTPRGTDAASTLIVLASAFGMNIEDRLKNRIRDEKERKNIMMLLSSPSKVALPLEEELNFLRLINKIGKKSLATLSPKLFSKVKKHFNKYCWLSVYVDEEPWSWDKFIERIKTAKKKGNAKRKLTKLLRGHQEVEKEVNLIIKKFNLDKKEISLFQEMMFWRIQVENFYSYVNYQARDLKREVAKRLYLSLDQLCSILPEEVEQIIGGRKINLTDQITERRKYYLMIVGKKKVHVFSDKKAKKILFLLPKKVEKKEKIKEIKGTSGHPGKVKGKVRVVSKIKDLNKVKDGEILVTQNTTPIFVPAMKKAKAVITDEGGITCHAAIVCRELGIPCIVGTKMATKILKNGDKIEVDATKGIARKV